MSKGFLIFATGEEYVRQAYLCALSIRQTKNSYPVSIMTPDYIGDKAQAFDEVIDVPWTAYDESRYQVLNRWKTYHASPYTETIVLDADTLVLQNIDDWWKFFSNYDLFFPSKVYTYRDAEIVDNYYRKVFQANKLPNLYSGIHYFKKGDVSHEFFKLIELISNNWEFFYGSFCTEHYPSAPSMDVTIAIATVILELEQKVTNKNTRFLNFVHMKPHLQDWREVRSSWLKHVGVYLTANLDLIIGNHLQHGIFHYVEDAFVTDKMIAAYEKGVLK